MSAKAAAGGHEADAKRLHDYWVLGEGLKKWATSPHPWTALHEHLAKYLHGPRLDETTSRWHYEVFHQHTGSDAYRVEHGGKMRGKRIGRG